MHKPNITVTTTDAPEDAVALMKPDSQLKPTSVKIMGPLLTLDMKTRTCTAQRGRQVLVNNADTGFEDLPLDSVECDPIPKHRILLNRADGTKTLVTVKNAYAHELADADFIMGALYGDWEPFLLKQQGRPG